MANSLQEYRFKLINKILFSSSQDEVRRYIDTSMKRLEQNRIEGHIIMRFIEKALDELEGFSPFEKEAAQWSNIKTAKVLLFRKQQQMKTIQH